MGKRKLGRGLDMLISRAGVETPSVVDSSSSTSSSSRVGVELVSPDLIDVNPQQPRKRFGLEDLEALKSSIAREGILQPLLVRRAGDRFQLVAGERRLRAARELSLEKVPVLSSQIGDDRMLEVALIENIHRADLNPVELGQAYRSLMDLRGSTQEELAAHLGISRSGVSNTLRLLDLSEDMQNAVVRGHITMGHAKVLLSVDEPKLRRVLFERIAEEKLSVRELELARVSPPGDEPERGETRGSGVVGETSKEASKDRGKKGKRRAARDASKKPYIISLEDELTEAIGTRVRIREKSGRGVVSVEFYSKEDFERLRSLLLGRAQV